MKLGTKSTLSKYWQKVKLHPVLTIFIVVSVMGASSTAAIIPLWFKKLFNLLASGVTPTTVNALLSTLAMIAILELVRWAFWRFSGFFVNYYQPKIIAELSDNCFKHLHRLSFSFFNSNFVGSLVKRVNYFTRAFESTADRITWNILPLLTELGIIITVLFKTNIMLGGVVAIWIVIFVIFNFIFANYQVKYDLRRSAAETKTTGFLADTVTNHSSVKLFNGYDREMSGFKQLLEKVRKLRTFTWNMGNIFDGLQGLLATVLEIGGFYVAIRLWQRGLITVGDFVLLQTYVIVIFERVWDFGKMVRFMYTDLADANEMTQMLDTPPEIQDRPGATELAVTSGKINFNQVDFYYHSTRKILSQFNLAIKAKEKVALVGPSGAGKSTVVKLLLRMHDIAAGSIQIDGQNIAEITLDSLWKNTSLVPQEPVLFHRSLLENIRYGKPEASDEEVHAAARLAHCHEFIASFPEGYETFVGERGVKLSGGERQRVAIARAILRNAPILVLDEATSSLDSESEQLIQDALHNLMQNKTVIVIAHRLSTIMEMDRIIVIDQGQVIEKGKHHDLINQANGIYQRLWKIQAGGFIE